MPDSLRLLLDDHYPRWLAEQLTEAGMDTTAVQSSSLQGLDAASVLRAAVADTRVVVTEDINTFPAAIDHVSSHLGVVFVHPRRYPRTRSGLTRLRKALLDLNGNRPPGLGEHPVIHWIA